MLNNFEDWLVDYLGCFKSKVVNNKWNKSKLYVSHKWKMIFQIQKQIPTSGYNQTTDKCNQSCILHDVLISNNQ